MIINTAGKKKTFFSSPPAICYYKKSGWLQNNQRKTGNLNQDTSGKKQLSNIRPNFPLDSRRERGRIL